MAHDQETYKRGTTAAIVGFCVQLVLAIVMMLASFWIDDSGWAAGTVTLYAITWHLFAGLPIWVILAVVFNEHRRERAETLEAEQLSQQGDAGSALFDEADDALGLAKGRLKVIFKWTIPVLSILMAAFLLIAGFKLFSSGLAIVKADASVLDGNGNVIGDIPVGVNPAVLMVIMAGTAFIAFMVARYQAGMTRVKEWKLLRGGAGFLMGTVVLATLSLAGAIMAYFGNGVLFKLLAIVAPLILIVLGFEVLISYGISFYQSRKPGEYPRPAFDSRLTGWLTSPESIGKIIRETLNYQFGFEVSRSWFYQLLSKSVLWLVIFGAGTLILISSVVIVGPEEQAIVTTFGSVPGDESDAVKGPGLHLKWFWPVGNAHKYKTKRIEEITIGSIKDPITAEKAILWGRSHGEEEYLVTAPSTLQFNDKEKGATKKSSQENQQGGNQSSGMALVGAQVVVQYRISNLSDYFKSSRDQKALLRALSERAVNAYFVNHDIDNLLARGRSEAGSVLQTQIQGDIDAAEMGLEVLYVGLTGMHPPSKEEVAKAFLEQIGALQEQESQIEQARQRATEIYTETAGSHEKAAKIHELIKAFDDFASQYNTLRQAGVAAGDAGAAGNADAETHAEKLRLARAKMEATELQIVGLIAESRGLGADKIYAARAQRWERVNQEEAKSLHFDAALAAYRNAPKYYATKLYLDMLAKGLAPLRKVILASQHSQAPMAEIDLKQEVDNFGGILNATE
jgi:modulator of FtsH protease HflK